MAAPAGGGGESSRTRVARVHSSRVARSLRQSRRHGVQDLIVATSAGRQVVLTRSRSGHGVIRLQSRLRRSPPGSSSSSSSTSSRHRHHLVPQSPQSPRLSGSPQSSPSRVVVVLDNSSAEAVAGMESEAVAPPEVPAEANRPASAEAAGEDGVEGDSMNTSRSSDSTQGSHGSGDALIHTAVERS